MISRMRAGSSPAFRKVCHWFRGLKMRSPGSDQHLVAQQRANAPLHDEAVLVFAVVPVKRRRQRPRGHRVLDQREALVCLRAVDHEPDSDAPQEARLAVRWARTLAPVALFIVSFL